MPATALSARASHQRFPLLPLTGLCAALATGCGDEYSQGVEQRLRVDGAMYRHDPMPGTPPGVDDTSGSDGTRSDDSGPRITAIEVTNAIIAPWQIGRRLAGRTTQNAYAVGIQLAEDALDGYWVSPVGPADPLANDEFTFELVLNAGAIDPGVTSLRLVALDEHGNGGPQRDVAVCVIPEYPDNLNACDPTLRPPDTVVTLTWNNSADLDLFLIAPDGRLLDARQPLWLASGETPTSADVRSSDVPRHLGDAHAACGGDQRQRETVVFDQSPGAGTWLVYARLSDLCSTSGASAVVEVVRNLQHPDGTWSTISTGRLATSFTSDQIASTRRDGTYLVSVSFP